MKRALVWTAVVVVVGSAIGAGYLWTVWSGLHVPVTNTPVTTDSGDSRVLLIEGGLGARAILERLESEGVIESAFWTRLYLSRYLGDPTLKAGEYELGAGLSAAEVLDKLVRGEVVTYTVTLVEGLDRFEVAAHLAAEGFGDEAELLRLVGSPELISDLDADATDLEGYLFPDTYSFARGTPESEVIATLVSTFRRRLDEEVAPMMEDGAISSLRELVTLASIVEKETSVDEERPVVAGVYANRLQHGMGLFADPTVIYGLKLAGTWNGNLRRQDLEADTPYNTYRFAGLPPGPICSPGAASLRAAARPADVPYLYFVSRNDGTHVFSRSLAEHNRNVEIWQKRYWREKWARERARKPGSD